MGQSIPATLTIVDGPVNGSLSIDPVSGDIIYTPDPGFTGVEMFTYTVLDDDGSLSNVATVTITVLNAAPDAVDDRVVTEVGTPITIDVLANDSDSNGHPVTIIDVEQPPNGTVTINPDGTLTYTPNPGFQGPEMFTYTISDGQGGTATATVTVDFTDVFDPPLGRKIVNAAGLPELEWRMVWINGGNTTAMAVRITGYGSGWHDLCAR